MKVRRKRTLGLALIAGGLATIVAMMSAGLVSATPSTGGATSAVLGQGVVKHTVTIGARKGTDVVVAQNTFPAGATSGWHSHPGMAAIVVQSGEITIYRERTDGGPCRTRTYHAGDTFFEFPADSQNGVNEGATTTTVFVTFFKVPHGGSARIERSDPGDCPVV